MAYQHIYGDTSTSPRDLNQEAGPDFWATFNPAVVNDAYAAQETSLKSTSSNLKAKRRKKSKTKVAKSSFRSMSTPQMQRPGMSDSDIDNKKRNKLGYQRISIACAHCRRRKIRCVLEESDPHQRCQNCIRLKKECLFYPVEQQGSIEETSQSSSKAGQSSTVSSSPGEIGSATTLDDDESQLSFPTLPSNAPHEYGGQPITPGSAPISQGNFSQRHFEFPPQRSGSHSPWIAPNESDPRLHETRPSSVPYANQQQWHFNNQIQSPGDFSPFPSDMTQQGYRRHYASIPTYAPQRPDHRWQQPARSYPHEQLTRSVSNDESAYMSGFPPFVTPASLPLQMHEGELDYEAVAHQQSPYVGSAPSSYYHNTMLAQPTNSQGWYTEPSTYDQTPQEQIGTPTEEFPQYQQR